MRTRYKLDGPGVADKGYYDPRALTDNYKLVVDYGLTANSKSAEPEIIWKLKWKDDEGAAPRLPEAPLFSIERDLCRKDPKTYDYIRKPPATGRDKKRKSQRPVSAGFDSRGAGGRHSNRRSFIEDGHRHTFTEDTRNGRKSFIDEKRSRSKSRPRSLDRETDIRESMPHRRAKDKTWWEGASSVAPPPPPSGIRSPRRSSMRV